MKIAYKRYTLYLDIQLKFQRSHLIFNYIKILKYIKKNTSVSWKKKVSVQNVQKI